MAHDRGRPEGLEELERQAAELLGCDSIEQGFGRLDPYDEAIFQAFDAASQAHRAARRAQERCDRAGPRIDAQADDLWRDFGWPLTMAFLEKSFAARHSDARAMYSFAEKASFVAERTPPEKHPPGVVFDLRARTEIELANALRVNDRFAEAEAALKRAEEWLTCGSGDLAIQAYMHEVKASLRNDLRRLPEALELLDEAGRLYTEIGDLHLAGRASSAAEESSTRPASRPRPSASWKREWLCSTGTGTPGSPTRRFSRSSSAWSTAETTGGQASY
jgi:tetratricopeptide (TPR) repeat protein